MQSTRNSTLATALVVGLGLVAGIDIGVEDRRHLVTPKPKRGSPRRFKDKRNARNKIARKSRAKNRGR